MGTSTTPRQHLVAASCDGLADGWARRLQNHQPVRASDVGRQDGPFYCAACHAEVVLRKGAERADHFAHEAWAPEFRAREEGALHRSCKREIHAALSAELPEGQWEIERTIPARQERGIPQARPDISGRVRGVPVAIEIQASALGIAAVLHRTRTYAQRRIPVLWVVPVPEQLADDAIRPRLHERYFHSMYFGRTYYWWPGLGASVLPVHYGDFMRRVPRSEWFRHAWDPMKAGGYDTAYRSIKTPYCGPRLGISRDFAARRRAAFVPDDARKAVPACHLWLDQLVPWW